MTYFERGIVLELLHRRRGASLGRAAVVRVPRSALSHVQPDVSNKSPLPNELRSRGSSSRWPEHERRRPTGTNPARNSSAEELPARPRAEKKTKGERSRLCTVLGEKHCRSATSSSARGWPRGTSGTSARGPCSCVPRARFSSRAAFCLGRKRRRNVVTGAKARKRRCCHECSVAGVASRRHRGQTNSPNSSQIKQKHDALRNRFLLP